MCRKKERRHLVYLALEVLTHDIHRYAMLLNGLLAAFLIVAGSFNGLVVLIGTLKKGKSRRMV